MAQIFLAVVLAGSILQKAQPSNAAFPDIPDNHAAYALIHELHVSGLLPEAVEPLARANNPVTRAQMGVYFLEAAVNLQRYVDDHRPCTTSNGLSTYSKQFTSFNGDQLKYVIGLTARLKKAASQFSTNLPSFVKWQDLSKSLGEESKLLDGLVASP